MARQLGNKFVQIWHSLEKRYIPEYAWQADRLTFWRERILFTLLVITVYLAPVVLIPSVALAVAESLWDVAIIDCVAYGVVLVVFYYRQLPLAVRSWIVCLLLFSLGTAILFALGTTGAGYMWLFAASVLTAGLIGLAAGAKILLLTLLIFLLVALCQAQGWLPWSEGRGSTMSQWLVMAANFLLLNTLITIATALMLTGLKQSLESEQAISADLRKSEARFRSLSENAPDVIFTLDATGRFSYANPMVQTVLGYPPQLLEGRRFYGLVAEKYAEAVKQAINTIVELGQTVKGMKITLLDAQGKNVHFILSGAPRFNKANQVDGMVGLLKDVTEMRLMSAQLRQAQKMEAVGTLAGGIAHDFNNLLAAIVGYAEVAKFEIKAGGAPLLKMNQILEISDRGKDLIKGILAFSRKVEPVLKPVDLNHEVTLAADMLTRLIPKMITIKLDLAQGLGPVMMDSSQLNQVMMNLGSNARDAMPEGGVLTIGTRQVGLDEDCGQLHDDCKPGRYMALSVADTGQGMDQHTLEHIFDPFFTQKEIGKGTGLGLAMVFGIVKNHGGFITCQSQPGQGTRFDLYWPYGLPDKQQEKKPQRKIDITALQGTHTVLVVDDEAALRDSITTILSECGLEIIQAENGEQALSLYCANPVSIDLVLLDLNMPGMGGMRCLDEILAFDSQAKVVITSGYGLAQPERQALKTAAAYIAKPYRMDELIRTIAAVLAA